MNGQCVLCPYSGILLRNKKERTAHTHNNMDESQKRYAKKKKADTKIHTV